MSPIEAGKSVSAWWTALPTLEKGAKAAFGLAVILWGGVVGFSRYYQLPARQDATEARVGALEAHDAQQDSAIAANRRGVDVLGSQMELQTCSSLARAHANGKTADECVGEYLSRVRSQP